MVQTVHGKPGDQTASVMHLIILHSLFNNALFLLDISSENLKVL